MLAVVSDQGLTVQRFDRPEARAVTGNDFTDDFLKAIKSYSPLDQYIVFYFKPSGASYFQALTKAAKTAGFEIGYDAVAEDVVLHFGTNK